MTYWLIKSEPDVYSIQDLQAEQRAIWDGVRNYQARNFLRRMQPGDLAFFYHSNTKPPGIVGLARVVQTNVVDPTQFDRDNKYYDPKSTPESPRWQTVEVEFVEAFPRLIAIAELREKFSPEEFLLVRRGNRLSVMPVAVSVSEQILAMRAASES
ncbi:MAG: EVE domain-containing protein [Spirulinaceae cyanobacterium SM2_1_0]|nr:EVE domain-containing protein [Spirulinaceae cyanobacterium SM2_1_0]